MQGVIGRDIGKKEQKIYEATKVRNFIQKQNFHFMCIEEIGSLEILNGINVEGKRILDLGCGDGYYSRYLKKRGAEVVGVDLSNNMIKLAKKNAKKDNLEIPFYKMDGEHLDFEDNYFDMVLTVVVLQHVIDENMLNTLLEEISRVLVGGRGGGVEW